MKVDTRENKIVYYMNKRFKEDGNEFFKLEDFINLMPSETEQDIIFALDRLSNKNIIYSGYADSKPYDIRFTAETQKYVEDKKDLFKNLSKIYKFLK